MEEEAGEIQSEKVTPSTHYWLRRWRKGPQAKECRQPLEAGKDPQ